MRFQKRLIALAVFALTASAQQPAAKTARASTAAAAAIVRREVKLTVTGGARPA